MNKKDRAKIIQKVLNQYFPHPKPFLHYKDFYTLLISVLLSAQCTDERVNQVTAHLFKIADTPEKMVQLPLKTLEKILHPLGFFHRKAKNLLELSKILLEKFSKKPPHTRKDLESLPGVGRKTASVVLAHSFSFPTFPVDTHIQRLAQRWQLSYKKDAFQIEKDLKKIFTRNQWIKLHLQMISFGRTYCKARGHKIEKCPICSLLV